LTVVAIVKVVVVFTVVQFIEGTFVYPIAVGKSVNMHPLVVIIGVAVGGQIGGDSRNAYGDSGNRNCKGNR
jgi:predicted PurR-regulated permease PerM